MQSRVQHFPVLLVLQWAAFVAPVQLLWVQSSGWFFGGSNNLVQNSATKRVNPTQTGIHCSVSREVGTPEAALSAGATYYVAHIMHTCISWDIHRWYTTRSLPLCSCGQLVDELFCNLCASTVEPYARIRVRLCIEVMLWV